MVWPEKIYNFDYKTDLKSKQNFTTVNNEQNEINVQIDDKKFNGIIAILPNLEGNCNKKLIAIIKCVCMEENLRIPFKLGHKAKMLKFKKVEC